MRWWWHKVMLYIGLGLVAAVADALLQRRHAVFLVRRVLIRAGRRRR